MTKLAYVAGIGAILLPLFGACHRRVPVPSVHGGSVVAEIDGEVITVQDLQQRLDQMSPYLKARYSTLQQKKEFLDNLVSFEVLAAEARREGFDKDPEVVQQMKEEMVRRLVKSVLESRIKPSDVKDADIAAYYQAHLGDYQTPEQRRCTAVVVADGALARTVAAQAKALATDDNVGFRKLVDTYSQDPTTKMRGGDLNYFSRSSADVPPEVRDAAFTLVKIGDVGGPIQTAKGFYVVKLIARHDALSRSLADVTMQIRTQLYRERRARAMDDWVAELRRGADVKIYDQALAQVKVDVEPGMVTGGALPSSGVPLSAGPMPSRGFSPPAAPAAASGAISPVPPPGPARSNPLVNGPGAAAPVAPATPGRIPE